MKVAELVRFMGPDERERCVVTIATLMQPSFVLAPLVAVLRVQSGHDPRMDNQILEWIRQLESVRQEMLGRGM